MRMLFALGLISGLAFSCLACGSDVPDRKEIAITIDDGPVMRFYSHPSSWHRALIVDSLTQALGRYRAPATLFVVGDLIEGAEGEQLLRRWLDAGVDLANHSTSHRSFKDYSYQQCVADIRQTQDMLDPFARDYGRPVRYFRYPFLEEGISEGEKATLRDCLNQFGLKNARVTITNNDWKFNAEYAEAELAEDWTRRYDIGQRYMQHLRGAIAHWEGEARVLTGRPIRQVLVLHANRINRDYLGQILHELQARGYTFITLDEAYADPVYREKDEWISDSGNSFIEHLKQTRLLKAESTR